MRNRLLFTIAFLVSVAWLFQTTKSASVTPPTAPAKRVDFNRDIRPILSDTCFKCHGPDEKQRMANLRLDETEGLFTDRGGYRIIVPGHPEQSKLYEKVSSTDESIKMPPTYSGRTLTPKQIELFKEWIDQGAKWDTMWSLVAPKRPAVPDVKEKTWPRNPIDNFVLARIEQEGINHSPEADKATLLRRVYFDLTGLPPTPAQIDAFIADKSPNAYEKRVDQLLASPHYGERMAMPWLDMARYADTHGYHIDNLRSMSPWRDWVIRAFDQNLPYDQFTIDQIAGDLIPNATLDQKIASGFNRNHMMTIEGGAIPKEYHVEYLVDRVSTTSTAFLGLTMGCARCHDHKYDPITQKDFYRFVAFFNTVPERGLDGFKGNAVPLLPLPSHEQEQKMDALKAEIASTWAQLPRIPGSLPRWRNSARRSGQRTFVAGGHQTSLEFRLLASLSLQRPPPAVHLRASAVADGWQPSAGSSPSHPFALCAAAQLRRRPLNKLIERVGVVDDCGRADMKILAQRRQKRGTHRLEPHNGPVLLWILESAHYCRL